MDIAPAPHASAHAISDARRPDDAAGAGRMGGGSARAPSARRLLGVSVLLPAVTGACMVILVALGALTTPASPLALGRADGMLGRGMPVEAVARYEAIGATSPFATLRKQALRRAARVYELELDQPADARRMLKMLLALGVDPAEEGRVREQLGELYLADREPQSAAHQYRLAYDADPSHPERLARAAEIRVSYGDFARAGRLWARLAAEQSNQGWKDRAALGMGELGLAHGDVQEALQAFQDAAYAADEATARAARLGLAACYERLGELDGALAQIDHADLPSDVRERRRQALLHRQATRDAGPAGNRERSAP